MLVRMIAAGFIAGVVLLLAWYCGFRLYNRRRAREVVRWIELAFGGHAEVGEVRWTGSSHFCVQLKTATSLFRSASIAVHLFARELPALWLLRVVRKQPETLTFQADLDCAPSFNLEVHNHRWFGRTRRRLPRKNQNWTLEQVEPFVLTTRNDWQRDITSMMHALLASRECECLTVCFRRSSPHFAVTVPLLTLSPASEAHSNIFDVLRELAAGAASARF
jgi:hypothetical protein